MLRILLWHAGWARSALTVDGGMVRTIFYHEARRGYDPRMPCGVQAISAPTCSLVRAPPGGLNGDRETIMALHADEALAAARARAAATPPPSSWPRQTSPQSSSWLLISASSRRAH